MAEGCRLRSSAGGGGGGRERVEVMGEKTGERGHSGTVDSDRARRYLPPLVPLLFLLLLRSQK